MLFNTQRKPRRRLESIGPRKMRKGGGTSSADLRIGISGWRYTPWRGLYYPPDLPQRAELEFAARTVNSVEINGSFYSLQTPAAYQCWYEATPPGFVFSVKGSRYISHMLRLNNVRIPLANFFASGLFNLREKLGPILWQFPNTFRFDAVRIETFLDLLPQDTEQALKLARSRDARLKGRARLKVDAPRPLRYAMEIRHESFRDAAFIRMLRAYNVALVVADTASRWPYLEDVTADFLYLRLHGEREIYKSGYTDDSLERWARRIEAWRRGSQPEDATRVTTQKPPGAATRDVYCYFDNDIKVHAPFDAQRLMRRLGLEPEHRLGAHPPRRRARTERRRDPWPGRAAQGKENDKDHGGLSARPARGKLTASG